MHDAYEGVDFRDEERRRKLYEHIEAEADKRRKEAQRILSEMQRHSGKVLQRRKAKRGLQDA